jgi:hypothetical protein
MLVCSHDKTVYNNVMTTPEPYNTVEDFMDTDEPTEAEMIAELMEEGYTQDEAKRMIGDEYDADDEDSYEPLEDEDSE